MNACWKYFLCSCLKNVFPVLCVHFEYDLEPRSDSWCLVMGTWLTYVMMNQLPRHGGWCSGKEMFFGHGRLCKHTFLVCVSVLIPSITLTISKLYCYSCKLTFQKNSILPLVWLLVWTEILGLLLQSLEVLFSLPFDAVTSAASVVAFPHVTITLQRTDL